MFEKLKLEQLNRLDLEGFKKAEKKPVVLVLDNIRSMNNIGSIFRTSDGFGIKKLFLCGITAIPPHRDIHKTALGAENSMDWSYHKSVAEVCIDLKKEGYLIAAVEQVKNSVALNEFNVSREQALALVLGNEVDGVSQEVIDLCDYCIEIPQFGTKHSFNVSVCAGIVMWELVGKQTSK